MSERIDNDGKDVIEIDLGGLSTWRWTAVSREEWAKLSEGFIPVRLGRIKKIMASMPIFLHGGVETSKVYFDPKTKTRYTVCYHKAYGDGVCEVYVKKTRTK